MQFESITAFFAHPLWAYYAAAALLTMPTLRIFSRAGLKPAWALLLLFPIIGYIICAGLMALNKWPKAKAGPLAPVPPAQVQP